ncbi:MAG: CHAD domain-containing protein [Planctomycetes bacterium]|nr:CHAD domain-containing protein [Planctomycetota bacterium]
MATDPSILHEALALESLDKAARSLRKQARRLSGSHEAENVHRSRVAARRLRTALRTFDAFLPAKQSRAWKKPLRKFARALGGVRDIDVQLEVLDELHNLAGPRAVRRGVDRIRLRLRQRRAELLNPLDKALRTLDREGTLQSLRRALERRRRKHGLTDADAPSFSPKPFTADDPLNPRPDPVPTFHGPPDGPPPEAVAKGLLAQLDELLAYEDVIDHPERVERLHEMRIAAKRLRYSLEMFEPLLGNRIAAALDAARGVQALLGEVHDCDVWLQWLPVFAAEEPRRTVEHYGNDRPMQHLLPGIGFIRQNRAHLRDDLYARFVALWRRLDAQRVWPELRGNLISPPLHGNAPTLRLAT